MESLKFHFIFPLFKSTNKAAFPPSYFQMPQSFKSCTGDFFINDRFGSFASPPLNFNFITKMAPAIMKVAKLHKMSGAAFSRNP
jgi:hypothetical protein